MPIQYQQGSLSSTVQATLGVKPITVGPSLIEQTRQQVSLFGGSTRGFSFANVDSVIVPLLRDHLTGNVGHYRKVREMRKHPTVKLVRNLSVAAMAGAQWTITANEDPESGPVAPLGAKQFIRDNILPLQHQFMSTALRGTFDFGWQPYEKVYRFNPETFHIELDKLKPLLQDQTEIAIYSKTGQFAGFKQFDTYLSEANSLVINQDVEGTYWYGEGSMSSMQIPYDRWLITDAANTRYDNKVSGSHWVVHYPPGWTKINGQLQDNFLVAQTFLRALEGSGSIVVPANVQQAATDLNNVRGNEAWQIELIESNPGAQMGFNQRLTYLDTLMVRAGDFPERAILEGQYGTKAEAGEHADFAVARMDWRNDTIQDQVNIQAINPLLILNYGQKSKGSVKLEIAPIADDTKDFLKQVYTTIISNPLTASMELASLDKKAIRTALELPTDENAPVSSGDPLMDQMMTNLQQPDDGTDPNGGPPSGDGKPADKPSGDGKPADKSKKQQAA